MEYKLGDYKGCGKCLRKNDCKSLKRETVTVRFKKAEKADCWCNMVTVFKAQEQVEADIVLDNDTILCASAESNLWPDYYDFIGLDNIEVISN